MPLKIKPKVAPIAAKKVKFSYPDNKPNFGKMENSNMEPLSSGFGRRLPNKPLTPQFSKYPGSPEQMKRLIFPQKIKIKPYG